MVSALINPQGVSRHLGRSGEDIQLVVLQRSSQHCILRCVCIYVYIYITSSVGQLRSVQTRYMLGKDPLCAARFSFFLLSCRNLLDFAW